MSRIGGNIRDNGVLPGKPLEEYLEFKDEELALKYSGKNGAGKKIPLQEFYDAYFDSKIEVKGEPCFHSLSHFEFGGVALVGSVPLELVICTKN